MHESTTNSKRASKQEGATESMTSRWVTEGLIIAAVPAIGYLLTYIYEASYNAVYGLPQEFMTIDLMSVLKTLGALSFVIVCGFSLIQLSEGLATIRKGLQIAFMQLGIALMYVLFINLAYSHTTNELYYSLSLGLPLLALAIFYGFVVPIFTQKSTKGYSNKVEKFHNPPVRKARVKREVQTSPNIIGKLMFKLPGGFITYIFITLFILMGSYNLGTGHAMKYTDRLNIKGTDNIVIKVLPDSIIGAKVQDGVVTRDFTIYPTNNTEHPLQLTKYSGPELIINRF